MRCLPPIIIQLGMEQGEREGEPGGMGETGNVTSKRWRRRKVKEKDSRGRLRKKSRECVQAQDSKKKERQKGEGRERKGREPGVIYASLGTRLYLFFPASCFTSPI